MSDYFEVSTVEKKSFLSNQDLIQKFSIVPTIAFETYKVMISSFLILFVPQKCGDHICNLNENLVFDNDLYNTGIILNFITMFSFLLFYFIEVKRENRLISYLEVNPKIPSDNDSVGKVLELLPNNKKGLILSLDKRYQQMGCFILFIFILNSFVSGFVVYEFYLDNQTTTTFVTNLLFMVTKISDIYATVNTSENVFYSAYLKGKVQYNDVDPDKIIKFENENENKETENKETENKEIIEYESI
jgi:hypothetical protein